MSSRVFMGHLAIGFSAKTAPKKGAKHDDDFNPMKTRPLGSGMRSPDPGTQATHQPSDGNIYPEPGPYLNRAT